MPTREPNSGHLAACARAGERCRNQAIANAAAAYVRTRHLPKILSATQEDLADFSVKGRRAVVARPLRLARNSARAGRAGHWSYDPNRHIAILGALQAERAGLAALTSRTSARTNAPVGASSGIST